MRFHRKKTETPPAVPDPALVIPQDAAEPDPLHRAPITRVTADPEQGLTRPQVEERIQRGWSNTAAVSATKSIGEIIRSNVFTYFNMIFTIFAILLLIVGSYRDMLFMGIVICNTLIGIAQEIYAKKVLDNLNVLNAVRVKVIRDGKPWEILTEELVIDDVIELGSGAQVPADAQILAGSVQVNEALLTGEADEIAKKDGDPLLSGSYIVGGSCRARLTAAGRDTYISKLTLQATKQKGGEQSEMIRDLDRLVRIAGVVIIPIGILLFYQQFFVLKSGFAASVTNMVSALIGMIPEGLYLTASVALATSATRLALKKVMIHDMKCIETLARVTVLCVDKTGTITEDHMEVKQFLPDVRPDGGQASDRVAAVLGAGQRKLEAFTEHVSETFEQAVRSAGSSQPEAMVSESAGLRNTGEPSTGVPGIGKMSGSEPDAGIQAAAEGSTGEPSERNTDTGIQNAADAGAQTADGRREPDPASAEEQAAPTASARTLLGDFVQGMPAENATMRALQEYFTETDGRKPERIVPFSSRVKYSGAVIGGVSYVLGAPEFLLGDRYEMYRDSIESRGEAGYRVLAFGIYDGELTGEMLERPVRLLGMVLLANRVRAGAPDTFRYFEERQVAVKVISGDNPVSVSAIAREAGIAHAESYVDASTLRTDEDLADAAQKYTVFGRVTPDQKRHLVWALQDAGETVAMTGDGVNDVLALKDADCSIAMASGSDAAAQVAQLVLLDSDFSRMPNVVLEGRRVINNIQRTASLFLVKNIFSLLLSVSSVLLVMNYPLEAAQLSLISMFTIGIPAFLLSQEPNHEPIRGHFLTNVLLRAAPGGITDYLILLAFVLFCQTFGIDEQSTSTACTLLASLVGFIIMYRIMKPMTKIHWAILVGMVAGLIFCLFQFSWWFGITPISRKALLLMIVFGVMTEPLIRYLSMFSDWVLRRIQKRPERRKPAKN